MDNAAPRLTRFLKSLRAWREKGIVFVPIRHHSPGCSGALTRLLDEVKPSQVLIEGPREYGALLPALNSQDTVPPIAVLSVSDGSAAFYPLASFSPEWIALRWGSEHGAVVDFIDRSYSEQPTEEESTVSEQDTDLAIGDHSSQLHTLQREQHLARSASIAALAQRLGCRDHDEVWEHLFEVRSAEHATQAEQTTQWGQFFDDVAAWCALARLDYSREVLDLDGTHARESVMFALLRRYMEAREWEGVQDTARESTQGAGPIVVVTGGFHTLGLIEALDQVEEGAWVTSVPPGNLDPEFESWLIRYDYERLDGLRGYGAGMPAPGYWQRSWDAQREGVSARDFAASVLLKVAVEAREAGELVSTPTVQMAAEQALRLMELRGRSWPGRTDILDALLSSFVKDENGFSYELSAAISRVFGGHEMGQVPSGLASPPLVAEARETARSLKFSVETSDVKHASLDTARTPRHVIRREFLAKMRFLDIGFARHVAGADVVSGYALGQFFEEWEYAWTPMVEASLIELSGTAPTLDLAVSRRVAFQLHALTEPDPSRKVPLASGIAQLLCEVAAMGSRELIPVLRDQLASVYAQDVHVGSLVRSIHSLLNVVEGSGRLNMDEHAPSLLELVDRGLAAVAYQIPLAIRAANEDQAELCAVFSHLYSALKRRDRQNEVAHNDIESITLSVRRVIESVAHNLDTQPRIRGCLLGLSYVDGALSLEELHQTLAAFLSPQSEPSAVAALMLGIMRSAPDIILRTPDTLELLDSRLSEFDDAAFMGVLPDLREAFGHLKPTETHRLATAVAELTGGSAVQLDSSLSVNPLLAARGLRIDSVLRAGLVRDGLTDFWSMSDSVHVISTEAAPSRATAKGPLQQ